jgi:ABC-type bacteriocin/lantibiotic exporter with double-glycine peptidase domain
MRARRLQHVVQKNKNTGCGPACVAMLARVTYEEARLAMFPDGRTIRLSSDYTLVRRAFKRLGVQSEAKVQRANVWGNITHLAIVTCQGAHPWLHWVVYDPVRQIVYDPSHEKPMHPLFSRQRPISYLEVTAAIER